MAYEMTQKVLFRHCDPAGIVFFPRYFEMMNDCVEAYFADALGWPFEEVLKDGGTPTASITTDFLAPSRHGDVLVLRLEPVKLGRSSMRYVMTARAGGEDRFRTEATLVRVGADGRPRPWPDEIRKRISETMEVQA